MPTAAKMAQIVVKQQTVEGSNPVVYQYKVVRLVNRLTPTIDTILSADDAMALVATDGVSVSVQ